MQVEEYFHKGQVATPDFEALKAAISSVKISISKGSSKDLRVIIEDCLAELGWSQKVEITQSARINITSVKGKSGLCLQTGNMSRFYADLIKLEYLYKKGKIANAIYILPSKECALKLGSNLVNFDRFVSELQIFQNVITIPLSVIGLKSKI